MDPTQAYLDLCDALNAGDLVAARELAQVLKEWFARGGFYPTLHERADIDAAVANALARTDEPTPNTAAFSLICERCDAGMEIGSEAEALGQGWTGIVYAPDLPSANYVGICPDCQEQDE
ncbi:hypothetical protein [Anatilimnocola floriformis]|uniref:hypothetical protein n=1 Tax=Anatilimnocola floriformis TaxID=2948575 RepID=UPI0020C20C4A|nr:hypothetical protein [Anatilimnocola floriformis]